MADSSSQQHMAKSCSAAKGIVVDAQDQWAGNNTGWRKVAAGRLAPPQGNGEQSCVVMADTAVSTVDVEYRVQAMQTHGHTDYWCIYSISVLLKTVPKAA